MKSDQYLICHPFPTTSPKQRKRPYEKQGDEEFQASKRFICENFWKLRISPGCYHNINENKSEDDDDEVIVQNEHDFIIDDNDDDSDDDNCVVRDYNFSPFFLSSNSNTPTNRMIDALLREEQRKWESNGYEIVVYNPDSFMNSFLRNTGQMITIENSTPIEINNSEDDFEDKQKNNSIEEEQQLPTITNNYQQL